MKNAFIGFSISQISEKIMEKEVSSSEITESCLEEIELINHKINAYVTLDKHGAIKAAETADKEIKSGKHRGPLHGIPIGIKDIIETQGVRTTFGSAIYKEYIPKRNATVINLLKKAGAVIIGKTNTHEFAFGVTTNNPHYGLTLNPWNTRLIPGGSSGGSAAAVATNLCYAALGSDTGGSIRIPSAFCGTVGLKPTHGRVSLHGVFPLATTFDHVGPLTRTVRDAAIMLDGIGGFDEKDPNTQRTPMIEYSSVLQESDIYEAKIGITNETSASSLDPEIRRSHQEAVKTFENLGAEIVEVKITSNDEIRKVALPILSAEAAYEHSHLIEKHQDKYGSDVLARIRNGLEITIRQYIDARRKRRSIIREMEILFEEIDLLLTPSVQIKAPTIGEETVTLGNSVIDIVDGCTRFTRLANVTGFPAIVLPSGYSYDGLPLSIQIMATRNGEKGLLQAAHIYEEATPDLRSRKPEL